MNQTSINYEELFGKKNLIKKIDKFTEDSSKLSKEHTLNFPNNLF